jgi:O-antigen/teichoic acid export membrane protein
MAIIINSSKCKPEITLVDAIKNILNASVASWIPALISTLGTYLGTIVIFGTQGSTHAGIYFIAFSIFAALTTIISVLLSIAYPALSAMHDGRKRFTWKVIKITLIVALPFSASLIFHSEEIMQLFGPDYIKGSVILEMLSLSTLFSVVSSGITILAYSQGKYKQAVVIGIASSIPRVVLYFVLVPIYGEVGGALSYTIGSITGFLVSIIICKKIGLKISWKELGVISIIPIWIAFTLSYTEVFYVVSIIVTFMVSFVLFLKFQILTKSDVQDTVGVLPNSIAEPLTHLINKIGKKINRHY